MPQHFRAVALDYDGTLTTTGRLDEVVLDALRRLREERIKLVLVTGRSASARRAKELDQR